MYANFGRESDYEYLAKMGVNLSDAIVLVRYGMEARQKKVSHPQGPTVAYSYHGCIVLTKPIFFKLTKKF